ncbi:MAG: citrate/2-methylcitrate synthase, partial [Planctomycetota bacterium]
MAGAGLEGVVAAQSAISRVDGKQGRLIYRGYEIRDLAEHCSFEEVAQLVWTGKLPNREELDTVTRTLAAHRPLGERVNHVLHELPTSAPPMSILRTAVSAIGLMDPRAESAEPEVNLEMVQELAAQVATIVASIHRIRQGLPVVRPEPALSHAGNF